MLDISKVESGKIELHEETIDLSALAASLLRLARERAEAAGVSVTAEVPDGLPWLRADERLIKQIMTNLLSNAIKFTPKGGSAVMRATCDGSNALALSVEDTGIGIAPEDIPRALERFGQIDSSLSRRYSGTGLGLPLVKAFTELHGGSFDRKRAGGRHHRDRAVSGGAERRPRRKRRRARRQVARNLAHHRRAGSFAPTRPYSPRARCRAPCGRRSRRHRPRSRRS